jgi:hypothetical protein
MEHHSYLDNEYGRWCFYFVVSKLWGLIDTTFLVAKGKPVLFLQWYHHWITLFIAYIQAIVKIETLVWEVIMNSFIHFWMYGHYVISTIAPNKAGNKLLTFLHTLQMVIGVGVVLYHTFSCQNKSRVDVPGLMVYAVYLGLFVKYYFGRYAKKRQPVAVNGGKKAL